MILNLLMINKKILKLLMINIRLKQQCKVAKEVRGASQQAKKDEKPTKTQNWGRKNEGGRQEGRKEVRKGGSKLTLAEIWLILSNTIKTSFLLFLKCVLCLIPDETLQYCANETPQTLSNMQRFETSRCVLVYNSKIAKRHLFDNQTHHFETLHA